MKEVDIGTAQANLLMLVEEAARGNSFVIAKDGQALVKVEAVGAALQDSAAPIPLRLGFMAGEFAVPDDFDAMDAEYLEALFYQGK